MPMAEVFPFADIGEPGSFPDWIRGLRRSSGVYIIKDLYENAIGYVGESHSGRLYSTLTRHFQHWTDAHETSGVTYDREYVQVAVIIVPSEHAAYLQNELICTLDPLHNRLTCEQLFDAFEDHDGDDDREDDLGYRSDKNSPPPDYDYDIDLLLEGIDYQWLDDDELQIDVPF